jgi:hypothetical protein
MRREVDDRVLFILKSKRLAGTTAGREYWPCCAEPVKQSPENESFPGRQNTAVRTSRPANPSSIQTVTVGPGVSPGHAADGHPELLVGFTTDREFHPAPKVDILLL